MYHICFRYTNEAKKWIDTHATLGEPFFLYLAFNHAHAPQFAGKRFRQVGKFFTIHCKQFYEGAFLRRHVAVDSVTSISILFLCYKQPVSIYEGKSNNVGKTDEDPRWWP